MFRATYLCCVGLLIMLGIRANAQGSAKPAEDVLRRVMPALAPQFQLELRPLSKEGDSFRISGTAGHIQVEAATLPTLLYGVNWYLKYVAHLQVSTN
jgi:alpha-N-acetylglucosaminidase